jgi:hypothetical protein
MGRQLRTLPANEGEKIVAGTTSAAVVTIPNYGVTEITSAANTWTLAPPTEGCRKTLYSLGISSAARVVQLSTNAAAAVKVGNQSATRITFHSTVGMCVELLGINSTQWVLVSVDPPIAANSSGIAIGTS